MDFGKVFIGDDLVYHPRWPGAGYGPLIRVADSDRPMVWGYVVDPMGTNYPKGSLFHASAGHFCLPKDVPEGT